MASDKIIIYDDTCPMCVWYTGVFVKTGLLRPENRLPFSEINRPGFNPQIDWERSRDEIPLVDQEAGVTLYGIDSMLAVLGQRFPWLVRLARLPLLRGGLRLLYKVVTYNRRAMSGARIPAAALAYGPHFHAGYRYLYLLIVLALFGGVLGSLSLSVSLQWTVLLMGLLPVLPFLTRPQRQALHATGVLLTPLIPVALVLSPAVHWPVLTPALMLVALTLWLRMLLRRLPVARAGEMG